jgi:hypothetical protein
MSRAEPSTPRPKPSVVKPSSPQPTTPRLTVALSGLTLAQLKDAFKPLGYTIEIRIVKARRQRATKKRR